MHCREQIPQQLEKKSTTSSEESSEAGRRVRTHGAFTTASDWRALSLQHQTGGHFHHNNAGVASNFRSEKAKAQNQFQLVCVPSKCWSSSLHCTFFAECFLCFDPQSHDAPALGFSQCRSLSSTKIWMVNQIGRAHV